MVWQKILASVAGTLATALILYLAASEFRLSENERGPALAEILRVTGSPVLKCNGRPEQAALSGAPVRDGCEIQTDAGSELDLSFTTGSQIKIFAQSLLSVQVDRLRSGHIFVTLRAGSAKVVTPGQEDRMHYFRGARAVTGAELETAASPLLKADPADEAALGGILVPTVADEKALAPLDIPPVGSSPSENGDTISDREIKTKLGHHLGFMQRCFLHHVQRGQQSGRSAAAVKGQVVLRFTISPRGQMQDVHVVRSDYGDEKLDRCLVDVVNRIPFRSFHGPAVQIPEFPLHFE